VDFIEDVLKRGKIVYTPGQPVSQWVNSSVLNINGITKKILFAHAPARIDYALRVPEKTSLEFSIGLVPGSWARDKGDGVLFEITLQEGGREKKIFSEYIDPKSRSQDRKWFDYALDLAPYAGKEVVLGLVTLPGLNQGKDNNCDWSVWGDLRLKSREVGPRLVYDQEAKIYENDEVFPRAFVVHDYELVTGKESILKRLKSPDFPLRDKIVLEEKIPEAVRPRLGIHPRERSEARIKEYGARQVEILAEMKSPGFLVLSDLHYPGWNAYVDGKKEKIYQTDYILRSVFLDAGIHNVKFSYEPVSFKAGSWIGVFAFILITGILIIGFVSRSFRKRKCSPKN
jgi:hypothetical protein